jgi:PEP-CTERM motif
MRQKTWYSLAIFLTAALEPACAQADLVTAPGVVQPPTIVEGTFGLADFAVTNTGPNSVEVTGYDLIAIPYGPDFSDTVVEVNPFGIPDPLLIGPAATVVFHWQLFTPSDPNESDHDSGLVGLIFSVEGFDVVTEDAVNSTGNDAFLVVVDAPEPSTLTLLLLGMVSIGIYVSRAK